MGCGLCVLTAIERGTAMCGIGGFSLSEGSKINPRVLSNALLTALEDRGYMASGFAYHTRSSMGYHKAPVAGSQLPLKLMPKDARTAIVHTRLATHGSINDNRNNHPVLSPSQSIALVHNGVIYNHNTVRRALSKKIKFDVDTAVIPALIEEAAGTGRLTELDGDAAIAWLSEHDLGRLHVARLSHSPMTIAQVEDGSFIFASTESLLWRVLIQLELMPTYMSSVEEYTYFTVSNGVVTDMDRLERPSHSDVWDYGYYRHQTAGAKGSGPSLREVDMWEDYDDGYDSCALPTESASEGYVPDCQYISVYSWETGQTITRAYPDDQDDDFEDDLWMIQNEGGNSSYHLIDYGYVSKYGEICSYKQPSEEGDYLQGVTLEPNDVF